MTPAVASRPRPRRRRGRRSIPARRKVAPRAGPRGESRGWGYPIHRTTLFLLAAESRGIEREGEALARRTGQILVTIAPAFGTGWTDEATTAPLHAGSRWPTDGVRVASDARPKTPPRGRPGLRASSSWSRSAPPAPASCSWSSCRSAWWTAWCPSASASVVVVVVSGAGVVVVSVVVVNVGDPPLSGITSWVSWAAGALRWSWTWVGAPPSWRWRLARQRRPAGRDRARPAPRCP